MASQKLSYKCGQSEIKCFYTGEQARRAGTAEISERSSRSWLWCETGDWIFAVSTEYMREAGISASSESFVFKK